MTTTYDITAEDLAPEVLFRCAGCDRDVEPHVLLTCDGCGNDVCCAVVETLSDGPKVLCKRCDDSLEVCDHCGEYTLSTTEVTSGDASVGYAETQHACRRCVPGRRAA